MLKKRLLALPALVMAAALVFSACTPSGDGGGAGDINMGNVNKLGEFPILKNKVELTMLINESTSITDFDTNLYTQQIEEKVNVDIKFEYLPSADADQKLSVMISSGEKLPDMITRSFSPINAYVYGSQGVLLPLNDLIDQTYYTKNYLETEEGQSILKYIYSPDGNIYGYPRVVQDLGNDWDHRMWINKTWLDAVGLDVPTTTDEFYNAMKAFKTSDPNGNGDPNDEIPFVGNTNGWHQSAWRPMMYSFTYLNDQFNYLQAGADGNLQLAYMQPEFRDGLAYLNKLCSEGLLSPLTFTQNQDQFKQIIENADIQIVGAMTAGSMSVYTPTSMRKQDMTHMPPLVGPNGFMSTNFRGTTIPDAFGAITKDCKDPVAAIMVYDFMYNRDQTLLGRFGEKDVDWKIPEGKDSLYAALGYGPLIDYLNPIWGTNQNKHWSENHPTLRTYDMICGTVWSGDPYDSQYMTALAVPDYIDKCIDNPVLRLVYTREEADSIAEIQSTLESYMVESVAAFVTGARPLSDWDTYLAEMKNIGSEKYCEVATVAYKRMEAN